MVVGAMEVVRLTAPHPAYDGQELVRPGIPLIVVETVAEAALLGRVAAICAASVGEIRPGRNATRNLRRSVCWARTSAVNRPVLLSSCHRMRRRTGPVVRRSQ
ncbi:hypothetical protein ADL12_21200 [Streptomyces regalis]|uniref:Uncharacterized protein n=1 Tax=Streptomyces regalis TaxID=68262 RepID=A0A0X3UNC6_9ACTN|nr:hypothetical protein ADL12_21200 [Streptomyces regalis]